MAVRIGHPPADPPPPPRNHAVAFLQRGYDVEFCSGRMRATTRASWASLAGWSGGSPLLDVLYKLFQAMWQRGRSTAAALPPIGGSGPRERSGPQER